MADLDGEAHRELIARAARHRQLKAALVFHMLGMFGQLSPLLGDLKISLLRTGIACSRRHSFGFFGSLPVFFRSFHADALRTDRTGRVGFPLKHREQ